RRTSRAAGWCRRSGPASAWRLTPTPSAGIARSHELSPLAERPVRPRGRGAGRGVPDAAQGLRLPRPAGALRVLGPGAAGEAGGGGALPAGGPGGARAGEGDGPLGAGRPAAPVVPRP